MGMIPAERDIALMKRALVLAEQACALGEVPIGAVLADERGAVVAEAANAPIARNDPTAHAEVLALRSAGRRVGNYRLPGTVMYVTLEPCPMCASALVHARVARVVFAADDPKIGACGSLIDLAHHERLNHRITVERGLLADEAARLLRDFFRERR
jgi:tRNA(adenine34) deaminase